MINAVLKEAGFTIGDNWLYHPGYAGMTADQVYQMLPEDPPGEAFDEACDKPLDTPDNTPEEWDIATVQAATAAAAHGTLPGSLQRFVKTITESKADWRSRLHHLFTENTKDDFSYARVNRRFAALNIFLPGLHSEALGEVVSFIDSSGSISQEIFDEFAGELNDLHSTCNPTLMHVGQCDTKVHNMDTFEPGDYFELKPTGGGGGTDFRPPFKWVEKNGIVPKAFVYLTDGYGSFPEQAPSYPVLWVMTTDVIPPWGEHVRIEL